MEGWIAKWWKRRRSEWADAHTIYYIAGDGDDALDGRHPMRAWRSIARLNAISGGIKANDQILYKRGFTYYGIPYYLDKQMEISLRIGAYGSGKHPVFPDIRKSNKKIEQNENAQ